MSSPLEDYVSRIDEACGEEGDYVVILRYDRLREALKRILAKCRVEKDISGMMIRASYKGRGLTLFATGRLLLKGIGERGEAESLLRELLSD